MIPEKIREMVNCYDRELVDLAVSVIKEMEPQEAWIDALQDCTFYRTNIDPKTGEIFIEPCGLSGYTPPYSSSTTISGTYVPTTTTYIPQQNSTTNSIFIGDLQNLSSRQRADYLKEIYQYYYKNKNHQNEATESTGATGTGIEEENETGSGSIRNQS